jgi:hypothetical protein
MLQSVGNGVEFESTRPITSGEQSGRDGESRRTQIVCGVKGMGSGGVSRVKDMAWLRERGVWIKAIGTQIRGANAGEMELSDV